jgi:DNA uptake protein ComE-like DNA-binding protein
VLYNKPFFNMDPTVAVQFSALSLSDGYRLVPDPPGPDRVDPNFVNPHNIIIIRAVRARYDPNTTDDRYIYVDRQLIYKSWVKWDPNGLNRFYGRNFELESADWWDVIYPWAVKDVNGGNILGQSDHVGDTLAPRPTMDIEIPYDSYTNLRTVGDIARIWTIGPTDRLYDPRDANNEDSSDIFDPNILDVLDPNDPNDPNGRFEKFDVYSRTVGEKLRFVSLSVGTTGNDADEDLIRLNLADPLYTGLFQYITVFDPRVDGIDNDGDGRGWGSEFDYDELKIPGRINVNTAPAHVIAQLPWMTDDIARTIVQYRDKLGIYDPNRHDEIRFDLGRETMVYLRSDYVREYPGFASIGELNLIAGGYGDPNSIWKYALEPGPGSAFPDLTTAYGFDDGAYDDFEERDLIFSRISNLATVRSDVFTAYILVRLGTDGPQKRVVAILDRSDAYEGGNKVKIIALHPLPYPK